jgi:hypothetical protein
MLHRLMDSAMVEARKARAVVFNRVASARFYRFTSFPGHERRRRSMQSISRSSRRPRGVTNQNPR